MANREKIYIPAFISDQNYNPAKVLPHLYFYNSLKQCERYFIQSGSSYVSQSSFPYFDNYSGLETTESSLSLLFFNEPAVYGTTPTASLYNQYWEDYVELLYNPRTRLLNASAIIPLADYFKMELNDIVEFRGNRYHLRAINDYNLKNGECQIQLLGPIKNIDVLNIVPTIEFCMGYSTVSCALACTDSANCTTTTTTAAPTTTTSTSTSTSTTSTSTSTSTTSTSTSTSTTSTTTASPGNDFGTLQRLQINQYLIPSATTYKYSFLPYSASILDGPGSQVLLAQATNNTGSYKILYLNIKSGSLVSSASMSPYISSSYGFSFANGFTPDDQTGSLCNNILIRGTGSAYYTAFQNCFDPVGPGTVPINNVEWCQKTGSLELVSGSTISVPGQISGVTIPNPMYRVCGVTWYVEYMNPTVTSVATQSLALIPGTYTQLGLPSETGTYTGLTGSLSYWYGNGNQQRPIGGTESVFAAGTGYTRYTHTFTGSYETLIVSGTYSQ